MCRAPRLHGSGGRASPAPGAAKPAGSLAPAWVCATSGLARGSGGKEGATSARTRRKSWCPRGTRGRRARSWGPTSAGGQGSTARGSGNQTSGGRAPGQPGRGTGRAGLWQSEPGVCVADPCRPSGEAPGDLVEPSATAAGVPLPYQHAARRAHGEEATDKSPPGSVIARFRLTRCHFLSTYQRVNLERWLMTACSRLPLAYAPRPFGRTQSAIRLFQRRHLVPGR